MLQHIKINYLNDTNTPNFAIFSRELQVYQQIYQHWANAKDLNPRQKEWVQEIGGYIKTLQQTFFSRTSKNASTDTAYLTMPELRSN